jgi:hypothetical protein
MATIREISEFHHEKVEGVSEDSDWMTYDGWRVVTDDEMIRVGIWDGQSCCESFGYFSTDDDPSRFVGADLLRVERVDGDLKTIPDMEYGLDSGGAVFVNFVTDRGNFQLAVYNAHNGYYGHEAVVSSRELTFSAYV